MTGWMLATEMHLSHKSIQHHRTQTETMRQHKPQLIEQKLELDCRQPTWSGLLTDSAKKSDDTDAIDAKNALKGYMNIFQALPIDVMLVLMPRLLVLVGSVATVALAEAFAGEAFDSALAFGALSCKNGQLSPRLQVG